jgi:hypothetical protein
VSETQDAIRLANTVLDTPNRDPDDDLSMMSRQFLRSQENLHHWREEVGKLQSKIARLEAMLKEAEAFIATISGGGETDFRAKLSAALAKAEQQVAK